MRLSAMPQAFRSSTTCSTTAGSPGTPSGMPMKLVKTVTAEKAETVTVYLTKLAWVSAPTDDDPYAGSMQASPAAGATILIDGRDTGIQTGPDGHFSVYFNESGDHIISAKATDGSIHVPPACRVTVPENLSFFQKFMRFIRNIFEKLKALFTIKK